MEGTRFLLGETCLILIGNNLAVFRVFHNKYSRMAAEVFVTGMRVRRQAGRTSGAHGGGLRPWIPHKDGHWKG